jgi:succinylglutamate desuccinylase
LDQKQRPLLFSKLIDISQFLVVFQIYKRILVTQTNLSQVKLFQSILHNGILDSTEHQLDVFSIWISKGMHKTEEIEMCMLEKIPELKVAWRLDIFTKKG